jgi:ribose/xylose/arabinose/galactoside ABC-type transport system permease subunit
MTPALTVLLVGLVFFFSLATPDFLSAINLRAILSNVPVIAIMAVGMTFVLLAGGLDLSVGSILGFTAVNVVLFINAGLPLAFVILASVTIGAALGCVNALIITKGRINPVIVTLGMMAFARGLASWFSLDIEALKVGRVFDEGFLQLARYYVFPGFRLFPITIIYVAVFFLGGAFVLSRTPYGRNLYAVGSNEYAARLAGIQVQRIKFSTYVISGVMASVAAVILVAQLSIGRDDAGLGSELQVITAVVLGGVSLKGGRGSLLGVAIAVLVLGVLSNGMVHLEKATGLSYHWREVVKGAVLILAIAVDSAKSMALRRRQVVRE